MPLEKSKCQKCFSLHEKKWDELEWSDGFVTCPKDAFIVRNKDGHKVPKRGEFAFIYNIYGTREVADLPPHWCNFQFKDPAE